MDGGLLEKLEMEEDVQVSRVACRIRGVREILPSAVGEINNGKARD